MSAALNTCFAGAEAYFGSPRKQLGTGIGTLPIQLREVHSEILGNPMLMKLYSAPFPFSFPATLHKHTFTQFLCSTCKSQGSKAITVKEFAENKGGKGGMKGER